MNKNSSTRPVGRKLTIFMLFCLLSMCFSSIWAQNVTLSQHARPLRKVLGEIERQTGYKFFYNNSQVDVEKKVNVSSKKENLDKVLARLFQGTNVSYKISGKTIFLSQKETAPTKTQQKKVLVSGVVKDDNGETVIGASVKEKGTKNGTVTDLDGQFSMEVTPNAMLEISYIGFTTQMVKASPRKMDVMLQENSTMMD